MRQNSAQGPAGALDRVVRHEDRFAWPLFVASLLWIGAVTTAWVDVHPSASVRAAAAFVIAAIWIWLVIDLIVRLVLAGRAWRHFVRSRIFDLITIAIPLLRPFLIIVFVWRLPAFRYGNAARMRLRYGVVTVLFACLFVYVGAYLVWAVEKDAAGATIVNFGDSIWWAFTTISTVGYGDYAPITIVGRIFAVGLMAGGVVVVGVTTATLISELTDRLKNFALARERETTEHEPN